MPHPSLSYFETSLAAGLPVLRWPELDATGAVDAVVTTRIGGVSEGPYESLNLGLHVGDDPDRVVENRRRAAVTVGLELDDLVFCRQSHGRNVAVVGRPDRGRGTGSEQDAVADTDALVTAEPQVGLVMMVADCVPIVLVDPVARVLGAVHAGWRGTVSGAAEAAVSAMVSVGAVPNRIVAGIGPAIDPYEVGDEVVVAAREAFGPTARSLVKDGTFDLWNANLVVLLRAGLLQANVHLLRASTRTDGLFSDRAERPCGRFAAIARLRP